MTFIVATLNHFRAVQTWARTAGADVQLDVGNFELEIKARHRYFRLQPQFLATMGQQHGHVTTLTPEATGLAGWLPYRVPLTWALSTDKLVFKSFAMAKDFRVPRHWPAPEVPTADFILKQSRGSFGNGLLGPYRRGTVVQDLVAPPQGTHFAEEFIAGQVLKLWFWGSDPFFAHLHDLPVVQGDGQATLQVLLDERLRRVGRTWDETEDVAVLRMALAYQQARLDEVLAPGRQVWMDYRYGRSWKPHMVTTTSDNALSQLPPQALQDAQRLGTAIAGELAREVAAPVLYSVDGVLDAGGRVFWLEMNSNPVLPPEGYPLILETLFG